MAGGKGQGAAILILAGALAACTATTTPNITPTVSSLPTAVVSSPNPTTSTDTALPAPTEPPALTRVSVLASESTRVGALARDFAPVNGWAVTIVPPSAEALREQAQAGVQVIVIDDAQLGEVLVSVARDYLQSHFIGLQATGEDAPANVLMLGGPNDRHDQAGFVAGMVAGHATETERVAVFSDTTTPIGLKYRNGFLAGVRYTCPKCRIDTIDMNGSEATEFASGEGARYAALGADVIFATAGQAGEAALVAAAQNGAWVIGNREELPVNSERALTSVFVDVGVALRSALEAFRDGQPRSGVEPLSLANGGVVMVPFGSNSDTVLSPLDLQEIEAAMKKLTDGSLETGVDPVTGEEK